MKKLMILLVFVLATSLLLGQRVGTMEKIIDKSFSLDSANASVTDSLTLISGKLSLECDSLFFIVELVSADSLVRGKSKDSIMIYAKLAYVSPSNIQLPVSWANYDSVFYKASSSAESVGWTKNFKLTSNQYWSSKTNGIMYVIVANAYPNKKMNNVRVVVWMYKKWR